MGGGECFVQIDMHDIHTEITRADFPDQSVKVRAIHVEISAGFMKKLGDFEDIFFKETACVGVGHHHTRDISAFWICRIKRFFKRFDGEHACFFRRHVAHLKTTGHSCCRVCTMRRVRRQDNATFGNFTFLFMCAADRHDPRKLSMRSSSWRKTDTRQSRQLSEPILEFINQTKCTLNSAFRLHGMYMSKAGMARYFLIQARVVLHRARAQREKAMNQWNNSRCSYGRKWRKAWGSETCGRPIAPRCGF